MEDIGGVWRTIGGRRVFIKDGEDLQTAMKNSGKFGKKEETESKTNRRGQITQDMTSAEIEELIQKDIGCDEDTAHEIDKAISQFTGGGFSEINDMNETSQYVVNQREHIEKYIEKAPKYDGEIYRGMHFKSDSLEGDKFISSLKENNVVQFTGISSWSSDENVANAFASKGAEDKSINAVVFKCKNESGVGIMHMSHFTQEKEVIQSSKSAFKITKVEKVEGYEFNKSVTGNEIAPKKTYYTYFVEVEEVKK